MISGQGPNPVRLRAQLSTVTPQGAIQPSNGSKRAIGQPLIEGGPQAFGGLEFRGTGREELEMEARREIVLSTYCWHMRAALYGAELTVVFGPGVWGNAVPS